MSAVFRRPDTVVATAAKSRARTPGTRSTRSVCGRRVDRECFLGAESLQQDHLSEA